MVRQTGRREALPATQEGDEGTERKEVMKQDERIIRDCIEHQTTDRLPEIGVTTQRLLINRVAEVFRRGKRVRCPECGLRVRGGDIEAHLAGGQHSQRMITLAARAKGKK